MNSFYESFMLDSQVLFGKINELVLLCKGENLVMALSSLKKIIQSNLNNDSYVIRYSDQRRAQAAAEHGPLAHSAPEIVD